MKLGMNSTSFYPPQSVYLTPSHSFDVSGEITGSPVGTDFPIYMSIGISGPKYTRRES